MKLFYPPSRFGETKKTSFLTDWQGRKFLLFPSRDASFAKLECVSLTWKKKKRIICFRNIEKIVGNMIFLSLTRSRVSGFPICTTGAHSNIGGVGGEIPFCVIKYVYSTIFECNGYARSPYTCSVFPSSSSSFLQYQVRDPGQKKFSFFRKGKLAVVCPIDSLGR